MKLDSLADKSVMILGFGVEGSSTYNVLRRVFPDKVLGVADRNEELTDSAVRSDENVRFHLGAEYLSHLDQYDVIIRSPGINKSKHPELDCAAQSGTILTSQTALFFENCPGTIIGVTGTKGKGTTSKLTNGILRSGGLQSTLVGNVGTPPLPFLEGAPASSFFVYELSAQQLEDLRHSPHIAVVLNIVPDHLDYFAGFEKYVEAKANIARFQSAGDYLVYNSMFEAPRRIAASAKSKLIPYSVEGRLNHGCSIEDGNVVWLANGSEPVKVISVDEIAGGIPGEFNLHNVLPAISVAMLLGVNRSAISEGIAGFEPLEHRFELAGEYRGIQFY
ncbi:MAG TPA: Mur ligase family protein, partial [Blastocatellia bacterium]|nr:Mur ligase family protein [Blastocatellia bacterium]